MTGFDVAVIAVVVLSTLLAFFRGMVREVIALASWIAGLVLAWTFEGELVRLVPGLETHEVAKHVLAFMLIFVATLVAGTLVAFAVSKLMRAVGLGFLDRFLGALFGMARGMLVVLLGGLTTLPGQKWWQNAALGPLLVTAALAARPYLPQPWADRLDYSTSARKPARPGAQASAAPTGEPEPCAES